VVGASAKYGAEALAIAVPIKLVRALWIVPVSLGFAAAGGKGGSRRKSGVSLPWFLVLFVLAAAVATFLPGWVGGLVPVVNWKTGFATLATLGKSGLAVTLFLIGASLNREALRRVGIRPLLQAVLLWVVAASASLWAIEKGWIRL
jgi:uncharacterized membrane protein YadS